MATFTNIDRYNAIFALGGRSTNNRTPQTVNRATGDVHMSDRDNKTATRYV